MALGKGLSLGNGTAGREDWAEFQDHWGHLGSPGSQAELALGFGCWRSEKLLWGVPSWVGMGHRVMGHVSGLGMEVSWR